MIEDNGCSLFKINNAAYKSFKFALRGYLSKSCSLLPAWTQVLNFCLELESCAFLFLREQPLIKMSALSMNCSGALKQKF